jgi:hypothetical protein
VKPRIARILLPSKSQCVSSSVAPGQLAGDTGLGREPEIARRPGHHSGRQEGEHVLDKEPSDEWGFWCFLVALIQLALDLTK